MAFDDIPEDRFDEHDECKRYAAALEAENAKLRDLLRGEDCGAGDGRHRWCGDRHEHPLPVRREASAEGGSMTPKEIVERVRRYRGFIPDGHAGPFEFSDIDHLLAIHVAGIELLTADKVCNALVIDEDSESGECDDAYERFVKAKANLAALCGWKAEEV